MFKKILTTIAVIIGLILLAIWSPWQNWHINFLQLIGVDTAEDFATLKIKSLAGELEIYVDDELKGTANAADSDFAEITPISVGEHTVTLKRKEASDKYYVMTKKINFEPGVDVVIAYDLGPNEYFSEGHILYSRKNYTADNKVLLDISTTPVGCQIYLDNNLIGTAPLNDIELDITAQHKLKFVQTGYDSLEITILPESQNDRNKLLGLTLDLEVNLFAQPIKITTTTAN
jgi:hypothetical protein